jgi:hypothetical protein
MTRLGPPSTVWKVGTLKSANPTSGIICLDTLLYNTTVDLHVHGRYVLAFRSLRNSPCIDNPATYITFQGAGQNRQYSPFVSVNPYHPPRTALSIDK